MVFVKFLHIMAISVWAAGLVSLPGLYVQRAHIVRDNDLFRLQKIVRFSYVRVISPAAFIAIATGTGLIFLQNPFSAWFSMKLAFVGIMVVIHVMTGLVIIRLFNDGEVYPVWRFVSVTIVSGFVVGAIFFLVLARPEAPFALPSGWAEPGALKQLISHISPWEIP
jgi:putative membrane protein